MRLRPGDAVVTVTSCPFYGSLHNDDLVDRGDRRQHCLVLRTPVGSGWFMGLVGARMLWLNQGWTTEPALAAPGERRRGDEWR